MTGSNASRGTSSSSRKITAKPVIYKSTALASTAPQLAASATPADIMRVSAIAQAHEEAERVRESFKEKRNSGTVGNEKNEDDAQGTGEKANAKKYERRLKMNRQSAAASRVRREAYIKALEAQLVRLEENQRVLENELNAERAENTALKENMRASRNEEPQPQQARLDAHRQHQLFAMVQSTALQQLQQYIPPEEPPEHQRLQQQGIPIDVDHFLNQNFELLPPSTFAALQHPAPVPGPATIPDAFEQADLEQLLHRQFTEVPQLDVEDILAVQGDAVGDE